jgi:hypothetical protein
MIAVQFLAALVCLKEARDVPVKMSCNKIEPVCGVEMGAEAVRIISRMVVILWMEGSQICGVYQIWMWRQSDIKPSKQIHPTPSHFLVPSSFIPLRSAHYWYVH